MVNFSIHPLEERDVDTLYRMVEELSPLTHHTWYTYWTEITCFGNSCFKACLDQTGEIIGFITSHPVRTTLSLEWFCWQIGVQKPYRQQGVGIALFERVAQVANEAGAEALRFTIEPGNDASLATATHIAKEMNVHIEKIKTLHTPSGDEIVYRAPLNYSKGH